MVHTRLRPAVPRSVAARPDEASTPGEAPAAGPAAGEVPARAWVPTRALGRAVLLAGVLLIGGVLFGRIDLVVLAMPFAIGTAVSLRRRPHGLPRLVLEAVGGVDASAQGEPDVAEGDRLTGVLRITNADRADYDAVLTRTAVSPWLRLAHADRQHVITLPAGATAEVVLDGMAIRWGRHELGPAVVRAVACDGLVASQQASVPERTLRVFPSTEPFRAVEAMPRAAGLVGVHRSRRPGEGGELAGVRVFAPGDRLRRIDWRVSLRARQPHVVATLSDRDAEVVLLIDVLTEAGVSGGVYGAPSVLDTTVRAAAAIAEHYLRLGDRVSLLEYGAGGRRLRPASGRRQYLTVLEWLLDVRATSVAYDPYEQVLGSHLAHNALLVVLTPLVDERSAAMLARLVRSGRFVIAVDTFPERLAPPRRAEHHDLAYRLWRLERENTLGRLREHGVPVVAWAGAGSLDLVLRDTARLAAVPRVVPR